MLTNTRSFSSIILICWHIVSRAQFSLSFQAAGWRAPSELSINHNKHKISYFRRNLVNKNDDDTNSILGETLRDGTYSWSSSPPDSSEDQYKRIVFDGCGSITLHQQPNDFVQPSYQEGRAGVILWSAAYMISHYLDAQFSKGGSQNTTVLELGGGLGLCSAVAAKHGADVVSTDNDPDVLVLLKENLDRNQMQSSNNQQVHVHSLDWMKAANDPTAENCHSVFVQLESLGGADMIILSDVIYGATSLVWDHLLVLLNKFCAQRRRLSAKDPIVLLGYTQRRRDMSPKDEATFFAKIKSAGMEAVLIPASSIPHSEKYMLTSLFELRYTQ